MFRIGSVVRGVRCLANLAISPAVAGGRGVVGRLEVLGRDEWSLGRSKCSSLCFGVGYIGGSPRTVNECIGRKVTNEGNSLQVHFGVDGRSRKIQRQTFSIKAGSKYSYITFTKPFILLKSDNTQEFKYKILQGATLWGIYQKTKYEKKK